jgi:hypothetical protein
MKKGQVGNPSGSMEAARVSKRSVGTSAKSCLETEMAGTGESVLERFAVQAIAGGAKTLKIEYDEGYEEVYACHASRFVSASFRRLLRRASNMDLAITKRFCLYDRIAYANAYVRLSER